MRKKIFLLAFSFLLNAFSLWLLDKNSLGWWASLLWFISLIILIIAFLDSYSFIKLPKMSRNSAIIFVGLAALFLGLRLSLLTSIPFFVNGDEAHIGLEARKIISGQTPHLFTFGWYNFPQFTFFLAAMPMAVFGNNLFGLRMASIIMSLVSIMVTYALTRLIFDRKTAIYATILLCLFHFHIHFSRSGTHYMQGAVFTSTTLYFFLRGIKKRNLINFVIAGILTGLSLQVYLSARMIFPLLLLYIILLLPFPKFRILLPNLRQIGVFSLAFLLCTLPIFLNWHKNPSAFLSRTTDVSIFSQKERLEKEYKTKQLSVIITKQTTNIVNFFFKGSDRSSQYGFSGPIVDKLTLILLLGGIVLIALRTISSLSYYPEAIFVVLWLITTLLIGGVLTIDAPFSPRLLPVTTPIAIIAAFFLNWLTKKLTSFLSVRKLILLIIMMDIFLLNFEMYFVDFQIQNIDFNSYRYTYLARFLNPFADKYTFILIPDRSLILPHGTISFLSPQVKGVTFFTFSDNLISSFSKQPIIYIFTPDHIRDLANLKSHYPWIEEIPISGRKGEILFYLTLPQKT